MWASVNRQKRREQVNVCESEGVDVVKIKGNKQRARTRHEPQEFSLVKTTL